MSATGFALFDTPIGRAGIVWGARGIVGLQLPEGRDASTRARIVRRFPGVEEQTPPRSVARTQSDVVALLGGKTPALESVELDMEGVPPFYRRVYEVARTIPSGQTLSYGEVAARLGSPGSARAVGQALGKNPFAIVVPCHRVLSADGKIGGFSASGGVTTKRRLLSLEGAAQSPRPAAGRDGVFGFDPEVAVRHLRASDPALARVIDAVGPFRMELQQTPSVFGALAESIVYQQLTGKAAATIFARVCALYPRTQGGPTAARILKTPPEKLRAAGLSGSKVLSLKDLARRTEAGRLPTLTEVHEMENEAIIERLTEVRGVGRWTVEMLLMFRLGRPDILPVDDYGIKKGFSLAFRKRELPAKKELERRGARWKPYRTVASWYLWRAIDLAKK